MGDRITLHLPPEYDRRYLPIPASRSRDWWEDNSKTRGHIKHCLPVVMANSLGYYILSPATFLVRWNGDPLAEAEVEILERCSHTIVDNHAAFGSFTVQPRFVPHTDDPGDFIHVRGLANERGLPYSCMEAVIEAWWSPGDFGLVYLLNRPGEFMIRLGQPIAQFHLLRGGAAALELSSQPVPQQREWLQKRSRPDYRKDLDYLRGRWPDGTRVDQHLTNWKARCPFDHGADA